MANIFVRSSDGNNSDDGSTWALAKLDAAGAAAIDAAGDTIYFSDNHSESTAAAITPSFAGTRASPSRILCVDDTGDPASPSTLATTAVIQTTGASAISWSAGCGYTYGLNFKAGSSTNLASINIAGLSGAGVFTVLEACTFELSNSNTSSRIRFNNSDENVTPVFVDCDVKFGSASQGIEIGNRSGAEWRGGSLLSGGTSPTTLFPTLGATNVRVLCSGIDLTNAGQSMNLFTATSAVGARCMIRNSKLPASWNGSLVTGTIAGGARYEMHNCDSGDTNYRLWIEDYLGSIKSETTIVKSSGASDGTTPLSWVMVSAADAEYPSNVLRSPEIVQWNDTTGSSKTVTVEIIHSGVGAGTSGAFLDDEVWLEVQYLGTSGYPLSSFITDAKASVLATAADQASSSVTWSSQPATPVKQSLSVTFTPQEKGFVHAVVCLAKASKTVYVDPLLTIA